MSHKLLDLFGHELIDKARDSSIIIAESVIDSRPGTLIFMELSGVFAGMSDTQREAVKNLVYTIIDEALHNVLYVFEYSEIATIRLKHEGEIVEDMREIATGDLQGYIFEWAEKYSKQPLGIITKKYASDEDTSSTATPSDSPETFDG